MLLWYVYHSFASPYGTITLYGWTFQTIPDQLTADIDAHNPGPKPGLGYSGFARRYLRNRGFFLFLWLLRCFSSPRSLRHPMHSDADDRPCCHDQPGFPIQRSQDQRLVANSPEHIAGSHVFHRLSTPRHSPCALHSLITSTYGRRHLVGFASNELELNGGKTAQPEQALSACYSRFVQTSPQTLRFVTNIFIHLSKNNATRLSPRRGWSTGQTTERPFEASGVS